MSNIQMIDIDELECYLKQICDAIRTKNGKTEAYLISQIPQAIKELQIMNLVKCVSLTDGLQYSYINNSFELTNKVQALEKDSLIQNIVYGNEEIEINYIHESKIVVFNTGLKEIDGIYETIKTEQKLMYKNISNETILKMDENNFWAFFDNSNKKIFSKEFYDCPKNVKEWVKSEDETELKIDNKKIKITATEIEYLNGVYEKNNGKYENSNGVKIEYQDGIWNFYNSLNEKIFYSYYQEDIHQITTIYDAETNEEISITIKYFELQISESSIEGVNGFYELQQNSEDTIYNNGSSNIRIEKENGLWSFYNSSDEKIIASKISFTSPQNVKEWFAINAIKEFSLIMNTWKVAFSVSNSVSNSEDYNIDGLYRHVINKIYFCEENSVYCYYDEIYCTWVFGTDYTKDAPSAIIFDTNFETVDYPWQTSWQFKIEKF
jgi:hypothetical protein